LKYSLLGQPSGLALWTDEYKVSIRAIIPHKENHPTLVDWARPATRERPGSGLRFSASYLFSEDLFDLIAAYGAGRDLQEELDYLIICH